MDTFTRSFKCFFCFCTMNTEGDVIPEAGLASVPLCQVPHYIYLSYHPNTGLFSTKLPLSCQQDFFLQAAYNEL